MATKVHDNNNGESLGRRIARLRKRRGITQVELAEKLGIGQPNVSDYERDVYRPNAEFIVRLAAILRISTDELLGHGRAAKDAPELSRRLVTRMLKIQELPKRDQQAILRTIDAFLSKSA